MARLHRVKIAWQDLSDWLGIKYLRPSDESLSISATEQEAVWLREVEAHAGGLDELERAQARKVFLRSVTNHWDTNEVMAGNFDVDALADIVNDYAVHTSGGDAILDLHEYDDGVALELAPPFVNVYQAAHTCQKAPAEPEVLLRELDAQQVVETLKYVLACLGYEGVRIDLTDWDLSREQPDVEETVGAIDRQREAKRQAS